MEPAFPGAAPPPPAVTLPGYRVERLLARGGFGTLLIGRREADGRRVAIKLAHPEHPLASSHLAREAEALRTLGPPTTPELYEAGVLPSGNGYLVMQLLELPTLADRLAEVSGPMEPGELYTRAVALSSALAAVHARGLVHCDLKPENAFVSGTEARLIDFGLARLPAASGSSGQAPPGAFEGTAEYMAPEQCMGQEVDARTDVYALGIILYEMITGRPPFFGSSGDVRQAHLTRRPTRPSELVPVLPALEDLVLRCLAKKPARRFASASQVRAELLTLLARREGQDPAFRTPPRHQAPSFRPAQTRRTMAVLFLQATTDAVALQAALADYGGQLAHSAGPRCAGVFDLDAGENPVTRALRAAEGLTARGQASAALVDLATVTVQRRASGVPRFLSSIFNRKELYPADFPPGEVRVTTAAADVLPELGFTPVADREGLLRVTQPEVRPEETTAIGRMGSHVLLGRERELSILVESARAAIQGRAPTLATVIAPAGHGRSHFGAALAERIRARIPDVQVLSLRAREPLQGEKTGTLRALLRRLYSLPAVSGLTDDKGHALLVEKLGPALGNLLWPAAASILGWLGPASPALKRLEAAPGALRSMSIRSAREALHARASQAPLCLLLDDAHFIEDVTLDALEHACVAEARVPLWICLLARPSFEKARPHWGERAADRHSVRLGPLDPSSAAELCRLLLHPATNVPQEAIARIVERTQRIPFFLVELVRGLKRQGLVRPRTGGTWYLATDELNLLPESPLVEWLADRELAALPEELAPYARLCALLDTELLPIEVEGVVHELERAGAAADFTLDPGHALRRLLELGLLSSTGAGALGFRNPLLRESLSGSTADAWCERLHQAAYEFYTRSPDAPEDRRVPRIAFHAAGAGMREEAAALYLDLAEEARSRHAYLEAEATYSRALELLDEPRDSRRLTATQGRGLMRYRVGRYEDSLADFARARELARRLGDRRLEAELLLDEATALDWINDYPRSKQRVAEAAALLAVTDSPVLKPRLLLGIGRSQFRDGFWSEARAFLEEAADRAETLGDTGYETLVVSLLMLGAVLPQVGRIDDAERVMQRVHVLCAERGDRLHLGSAINNRRMVWVARKDLARALRDQELFMELGRELGMVGWEYFAEYNLGELLYQAGDLAASEPHVAQAVALERRHPEVAPRPLALLLRARLLAFQGDEARARQVLEEIRVHQARAQSTGRPAAGLSPSEEVLFTLVDLATRDPAPGEWSALRERSREHSVEQEPLEVLELMGLAALRRGRREEALRSLEEARELASRLPNVMEERLQGTLALARAG